MWSYITSTLYLDSHLSMSARIKIQEQSEVVSELARLSNIFGKCMERVQEGAWQETLHNHGIAHI